MKLLFPSFPVLLAIASLLSGQVNTPAVGYVRYPDSSVHTVYGLQGNYVVGENFLDSVEAASFSDAGALLSKSGSLLLLQSTLATVSSIEIPQPASVVHLDRDLTTAIAWLPSSHTLIHWNGKSFLTIAGPDLPVGSRVTSVRKLGESEASLLAVRPDSTIFRYVVSLETGAFVSSAPLAGASVFAFEDSARILCFVQHKLTVMSLSGEVLKSFSATVDEDLTIEYAASHCLHLSSKAGGREWLLHTAGNDFQLFQLPRPSNLNEHVVISQRELAK